MAPNSTPVTALAGLVAIAATCCAAGAEPAHFQSRQLTPSGEYTSGIEGPAVDLAGNLYVVNFREPGTIGKVDTGGTRSHFFARLPAGSIGNGIRFDGEGRMYVADFKKHNIFVFEPSETTAKVYFNSERFNQPNDLAIAEDGTLYASDPRFPNTGQIWRIVRGADGKGIGEVMAMPPERPHAGVTNGIDLSPDGTTLYVGESNTREVWAYRLDGTKLSAPRRIKRFSRFELDGLRTDVAGRIFVTRPSHGTVAILVPPADGASEAMLLQEVTLRGKEPTNLTFGGPDGRSVFVTQKQGRFIETFRTDKPGREPCLHVRSAERASSGKC
jgi:sugar lactone lactonase YvrE